MIQIGDIFDTEGYDKVKVIDIFISPTSQERVYKIIDEEGAEFLVSGQELTC